MLLHQRLLWNRLFLTTLVALPITAVASMTQPTRQVASPSSYPTIASSTAPLNSAPAGNIHPTVIPELRPRQLRRQAPDSLGWNNPSTCNIGVCDSEQYCTVYESDTLRASIVTGVCCLSGGTCPYRSACVDYTFHTRSTASIEIVTGGTVLCGSVSPNCASTYVAYGYGLGTFFWRGCDLSKGVTTITNRSWKLYRDETSPAKGPMPTTTISSDHEPFSTSISRISSPSTPAPSISVIASVVSGGGRPTGMPTGAIAGIAIGGIVVILLGVVAIMVVRSKLRKSNPPTEVMSPFQPKEPLSPTLAYTNSTVYPSTQQPEQVRHQGPVWEADSGLRIDTQQVWPAAQLRGP